jgi:hypothetical protein
MPGNRPTRDELLEAVAEFLEKRAMPRLDEHTAFHARVAVNVLAIVRRELALGPRLEREEHDRLRSLLGREGTLEELNSELCARIRSGEMDSGNPALMEHLFLTTMGKVSIDQPTYSAYRRSLEEENGGASHEPS